MNYFARAVRFEFSKMFSGRAWLIIFGLVAILQPLLAFVEAKGLASMGPGATPEMYPMLAEALPPIEYFGFDVVLLGQAAIVVLGAIIGASEYGNREVRTTLLCLNKRLCAFLSKITAVFVGSIVISFIATFATIAITHIALGEIGLSPLVLSPVTWQFVAYVTVDWTLLTLLSFAIGAIARNAIVPLLLVLPQVVGFGALLAQTWDWGKYLPVVAGNLMFATPTDFFAHDPVRGGLVLCLWTAVSLLIATYLFVRRDVGGGS